MSEYCPAVPAADWVYPRPLPPEPPAPIAAESTALKRISHTVGEITITVETTGSVALLAELLALAMKEVT